MGLLARVLAVSAALIAFWVMRAVQLRKVYLETGLEPKGSGMVVKDLAAYAMTSLPRIGRILKTGSATPDVKKIKAQLEGPHTSMDFSPAEPSKLLSSPHFAENYYVWINDPSNTDFLVTTRLSFYGVNASTVIPWFTFQLHGEEWNLPDSFNPLPHDFHSDPRIANDPELGTLIFENPHPMQEWKIKYKGFVQSKTTGKLAEVDCKFTLYFSERDVFFYQIHWDEMATALALSAKPWSQAVFKNLRDQNQERYASKASEAHGEVTFVGSGETVKFNKLQASRDHLWGIRNWLFMYRYIWWPPITLREPLVIEGVQYTSFIGAFVEYGNTLKNMVVGGFMSNDGECASFSGATSMRDIAPEWYDVVSKRGWNIGDKYVPGNINFKVAVLNGRYIIDVELERGKPAGMWSHSFGLADGDFEIHEALTKFKFVVKKAGSNTVLSTSSALGMFEFGGNLLGKVDV